MRPHFTLAPLLIAVASIGAVLTTARHDAPLPEPEHAHAGHVHAHAQPDMHAVLAEMTVYAVHHLGAATLHPETFHSEPRWSPAWYLQSVTGETEEGQAFVIYLATHKQHPEFRFATIAGAGGEAADWTPIR